MELSIIIPTFNKMSRLNLMLTSLYHQNYPKKNYEIIVVDDAQMDDFDSQIVKKLDVNLRVIRGKSLGAACAKNLAIEVAKGKVYMFLDDDVLCPMHFLRGHMEFHETGANQVVTGKRRHIYIDMNTKNIAWLKKEIEKGNFCNIKKMSYVDFHCNVLDKMYKESYACFETCWVALNGCNFSVDAELVKKVGGFNSKLRYLEDTDIGLRLKNARGCFRFNERLTNFHLEHAINCKARKNGWNQNFAIFKDDHGKVADMYRLYFEGKISLEEFEETYKKGEIQKSLNATYGSYWFWEEFALRRWKKSNDIFWN